MARRPRACLGGLLVGTVVLLVSGCFLSSERDVDAQTASGTVRGVADDGVRSWLGIPYAASPVGDLRWRAPQPPDDWSGTRAADEFGNSCLQRTGGTIMPGSSEDCLFLNVFRDVSDQTDLPVMVWLHGGSLETGSGDLPPEMVAGLTDDDVVVVSLNYRLGQLGFFAHPALAAEARDEGDDPAANFGLLDQVAALRWVRDNIAGFGGDPDNVTIFGISAGGASVNYLMTSPLATGLFDRAISGSGLGAEQPPTYEAAARHGEDLMAGLGAADAGAAELRDLDADAIAELPTYLLRNEVPILDRALPTSVSAAFANGDEAEVPLITGTTDRELIDDNYVTFGIDPVAVRQQLVAGREDRVLSAYGSVEEFDRRFLNDVVFTQPAREMALAHSSRDSTYLYRFGVVSQQILQRFGGAVHGADYPYVFGYGDGDPNVPNSQDLADEISDCWSSFATTGRPTCAGVTWPEATDGEFVEFTNDGPEVRVTDPWEARLDLVADIRSSAASDDVD